MTNEDVELLLTAAGFSREIGGGGCEYLTRYGENGAYIMATCREGGGMPEADDWWLGVYAVPDAGECAMLIRSEDCHEFGIALGILAAVCVADSFPRYCEGHRDTGRGVCAHCGTPMESKS